MSPGIVQDPALAATPRCSLPLLGLAQSDGSKEMTLRDQGYRGTASGSLYACGSMALDQFSARLPLGSTNCSWVLPWPVRQPVSDFLTPARPDQSAVFVGAEITRYQNGQPACPKGHGGRTT